MEDLRMWTGEDRFQPEGPMSNNAMSAMRAGYLEARKEETAD